MISATVRTSSRLRSSCPPLGSVDASGTARNMYTSANAELQFNVAASRHIIIDPANFKSAAVIRVRSGTSGVPVNQAADRIITLVCRDIPSLNRKRSDRNRCW